MIVPLAYIMCTRIPPLFARRKTIARVFAVLMIAAWIAGDGLKLLIYVAIPGFA
jgi:hypothetical protein